MAQNENILTRLGKLFQSNIIVRKTPDGQLKVKDVNFGQSTILSQGAASDFYAGFIQCRVYVPKNKGTSVLAAISESVIDGMTSVNATNYADTFSCKPKVSDVSGPGVVEDEAESHYLGVITCQFSAIA